MSTFPTESSTDPEDSKQLLDHLVDLFALLSNSIKTLYHTPHSRRGDIMIHAKSILALTTEGAAVVDAAFRNAASSEGHLQISEDSAAYADDWAPNKGEDPIGWTYLGSSNFTRAAHGNIGGSLANPTMSTLNWELYVGTPPPPPSQSTPSFPAGSYDAYVDMDALHADPSRPISFRAYLHNRGVVLPIYASEVVRFGVQAQSLRPIVYHRQLQPYSPSDTPWVSPPAHHTVHKIRSLSTIHPSSFFVFPDAALRKNNASGLDSL